MAKNNKLVNQYKEMYKQITQITPKVYAALALALHREYGWGYTRINRAFATSQDIWDESNERDIDMIKMCEEETGITLMDKKAAEKELG